MFDLGILIPVFNEEKRIENILKKIKDHNVCVINDGSTDKTLKILNKFKTKVDIINLNKNYGYEKALLKGFEKLKKKFKFIVTIDGDGEHSPSNIKKIYNIALKKNADLIIGNRSKLNRFSEYFLSLAFYFRYNIKDPISGFKIYKTEKLKKILKKHKNDNTFLVSIVSNFLKHNFNVVNFSIKTHSRKDPRVVSSVKVHLKILKLITILLKL